MRMMMTVRMEVQAANRAIADGTLGPLMEDTMKRLQPEAAYFATRDGERTGFIYFDMARTDQIPGVAEPWFQATNAKVDFTPVMNAEDVAAGIEAWQSSR